MGNWRYTTDFEDCAYGKTFVDLMRPGMYPGAYLKIGMVDGKKCMTGIGFGGVIGTVSDVSPFGENIHMTSGYMVFNWRMRTFQPANFLSITVLNSKVNYYTLKFNFHAERSNQYWVGIYYGSTMIHSLTFTEYASNKLDDISVWISRESIKVTINRSTQEYTIPEVDQPDYLRWAYITFAKNIRVVLMDYLFSTNDNLDDSDSLMQIVHFDGQGMDGVGCALYAEATNGPDYELTSGAEGFVDFSSIPVPDGTYRITVLDAHGYSLCLESTITEGYLP